MGNGARIGHQLPTGHAAVRFSAADSITSRTDLSDITLDALTGILALVALKPMRKGYLAGK
jgi:hypothetical protein